MSREAAKTAVLVGIALAAIGGILDTAEAAFWLVLTVRIAGSAVFLMGAAFWLRAFLSDRRAGREQGV